MLKDKVCNPHNEDELGIKKTHDVASLVSPVVKYSEQWVC
jgi:hypothetical protein